MFFENIKMALRNFVTNKMRTILSLLGIVIGVSSVILITTLSTSATAGIEADIGSLDMNLVSVSGGWGGPRSQKLFSPGLGRTLEEEVPGIGASTPIMRTSTHVKSLFTETFYNIQCVRPTAQKVFNFSTVAGRFFTEDDAMRRYPVIVLGYEAAERLFPTGGALGSSVKLLFKQDAYQMIIIGILEKKDPTLTMSFDNQIFMNLSYYTGKIAKVESVNLFYLKAKDADTAERVAKDVETYLGKKTPGNAGSFWVSSASSRQKTFEKMSNTLNLVFGGIAAISLLVGGIGIMNIMLVSVTERTREIGIRKALGAPKKAIRRQFLTESSVLTFIGGILGSLSGFAMGRLGTMIMKLSFVPDYSSFGLAIGFSAVIGIFFGFYPAVRASKLDPIQALSYE